MIAPLRRHRRPRGITLVEAVVGSAIAAVAMLAVLAVLVQLTSASASTLSRAELARQVTQLDTQLTRDVATALPCRSHRVGAVVRTAQPNRVAWTADPDGDGVAELVTYAFAGGQLLRSTTPDSGDCEFTTEQTSVPTSVSVVLDGLSPDGPQDTSDPTHDLRGYALYLVAPDEAAGPGNVVDGVDELLLVGSSRPDAAGVVVAPLDCTADPTDCLAVTGLRVSVTATTSDNTTVSIDRTMTFPDDRARLTPYEE